MSDHYLDAVCLENQGVNKLFAFLGAKITCMGPGEASVSMPVSVNLTQGGGMIGGGILATLADEAMAHAVLTSLKPGQRTVTTEMNVRYLRAADPAAGGELTAKARIVKQGRHLCVTEAIVSDSDDRMLAIAGGSFLVMAAQNS